MWWGEVEVNIVAVESTARLGWGGLSGTGGGWDGGRPSLALAWLQWLLPSAAVSADGGC